MSAATRAELRFKVGDWALHKGGGLDAREVVRAYRLESGAEYITLRIGTQEVDVPADNYDVQPDRAAEMAAVAADLEAARDPECVYLLDSGDVCGADGTVFRVHQVVPVAGNTWGSVRSSGPAGRSALLCPAHVVAALTPADGDPLAVFLVEVVAEAAP